MTRTPAHDTALARALGTYVPPAPVAPRRRVTHCLLDTCGAPLARANARFCSEAHRNLQWQRIHRSAHARPDRSAW